MFAWLGRLLAHPPKPKPAPVPDDKRDDIIGEILRFGEAAGGNAAQAQAERPSSKAKE